MSTLTVTKVHSSWLDAKTLLGFVIATGLGVLMAAYPLVGLGGLAMCLTLYAILRWCRGRLELWQTLVLAAMTPYIILNYGFDNLAVGVGGFHFPVGELLMFLALALVIFGKERGLLSTLLDPPVVCLFALLLLSCVHLVIDVPRYGIYAVRDSSLFVEAVFLLLGAVWARNPRKTRRLVLWMFFVFLLNLIYTYTFPWNEQIQAWSPTSGVFHPVPLFGNYEQNGLFLVAGALFCIWLGPSLVRWPRWVLLGLVVAQLGGLAILQLRSMYVGILVVLLLLFLLRETKKLAGFASALGWGVGGVLAMLLAVSALGISLRGRMGPVDLSFIEEHGRTILAVGDANARMGHDVDRGEWYGEVWDRIRSSPSNLIVGEGFGQALIDFENEQGVPVRQPHNTSLTILARLGFLGLSIWLLFLVLMAVRYVRFIRTRRAFAGASALVLWLFMYSVLALLFTSVQPEFEFSHGAIPFFFLQGLAIGIMRNADDRFDFRPLAA
ncbi:MAG: O-antigen ligase family protein [Candidatus Acidiferrales bacterium]